LLTDRQTDRQTNEHGQKLSVCEKELEWLDMSINVKKSICLRIGARCNVKCECITTIIKWWKKYYGQII